MVKKKQLHVLEVMRRYTQGRFIPAETKGWQEQESGVGVTWKKNHSTQIIQTFNCLSGLWIILTGMVNRALGPPGLLALSPVSGYTATKLHTKYSVHM